MKFHDFSSVTKNFSLNVFRAMVLFWDYLVEPFKEIPETWQKEI